MNFHPLRLGMIFVALLILFLGGLVVSMKIGGGVDIHNLDAYLSLLLIVAAYIVLRKYAPEKREPALPFRFSWPLAVLLVAVPAWLLLGSSIGFKSFDVTRTQSVIDALQARVNEINTQNEEILFITQRHLISMHMLDNVKMIPEYEREELMEMAMGDNEDYLQIFQDDMERQRFTAIVVDPLAYRLLGKNYAFGEENNAWVRHVMKPILCNYQEDLVFPADQIAVYVPQEGTRQCP
jgi:amino acid transporter